MCPDGGGGGEERGGEEGKEATVSEGGRRRSGESLGAHEGGTKQRQRDPQRVHSLMPTDTSRLHLLQLQRSSAVTPLRDTRDIWRVFGLKEKQCVSLHLLLLFHSFLFSYFSCVKQDKVSRLWNWLGREGRSWEFWERVREEKKNTRRVLHHGEWSCWTRHANTGLFKWFDFWVCKTLSFFPVG